MNNDIVKYLEMVSDTTTQYWLKILEAFSKLKGIDCYNEFAISCENKLKEHARSLN
jgi:hypothetical protein